MPRQRGSWQLSRTFWDNCCQCLESPRKAYLLGSFWERWNGLHTPFPKPRAKNDGGNSSYSSWPLTLFFGPLLTWETGALLALWKISFQSSGGWRADYAGPLLGLRHMETDSTCWGSGLREKRSVQESGWGLGDKAAAAWLTKDGDKRQATCRGLSGGSECLVCPGIHIPFFLHLFSFPIATSCGDSRAKCKVSIPVNSLLSLLCSAFPDSFNN